MSALTAYDWPGNVRGLQNLIDPGVILSNDGVLPNPLPPPGAQSVIAAPAATTLKASERMLILNTLESVGWVIGGSRGAAPRLWVEPTNPINTMEKLRVSRPPPGRLVLSPGQP